MLALTKVVAVAYVTEWIHLIEPLYIAIPKLQREHSLVNNPVMDRSGLFQGLSARIQYVIRRRPGPFRPDCAAGPDI